MGEEDVVGEVYDGVEPGEEGFVFVGDLAIDDGEDSCEGEVEVAVQPVFESFDLVDEVVF